MSLVIGGFVVARVRLGRGLIGCPMTLVGILCGRGSGGRMLMLRLGRGRCGRMLVLPLGCRGRGGRRRVAPMVLGVRRRRECQNHGGRPGEQR